MVKQYHKPPHLLMVYTVYTTHKKMVILRMVCGIVFTTLVISLSFLPWRPKHSPGKAGAIEALVAAMKTHHADARVQSWAACPVASDLTLRRGCRQTFGIAMLNS